jgi:hypothetical protein
MPFAPAQPITENSGGDGNLGNGLAKEKSCTDMNGLLSPKNNYKSLLGPYECQNLRFCPSLNALMRPFIVKMTWSRPKMPCLWGI